VAILKHSVILFVQALNKVRKDIEREEKKLNHVS
jgi:hypothetical protein